MEKPQKHFEIKWLKVAGSHFFKIWNKTLKWHTPLQGGASSNCLNLGGFPKPQRPPTLDNELGGSGREGIRIEIKI